jgi:hypothetical protein
MDSESSFTQRCREQCGENPEGFVTIIEALICSEAISARQGGYVLRLASNNGCADAATSAMSDPILG